VTDSRAGDSRATDDRAYDTVLADAMAALVMPRRGLRRWLHGNKSFCLRHGGRRYYAELLDLYDQCLAVLDRPARPPDERERSSISPVVRER